MCWFKNLLVYALGSGNICFFLSLRLAGFLFVGMRKGRCPEKEKKRENKALHWELRMGVWAQTPPKPWLTSVSSLRVIVKEPSRFWVLTGRHCAKLMYILSFFSPHCVWMKYCPRFCGAQKHIKEDSLSQGLSTTVGHLYYNKSYLKIHCSRNFCFKKGMSLSFCIHLCSKHGQQVPPWWLSLGGSASVCARSRLLSLGAQTRPAGTPRSPKSSCSEQRRSRLVRIRLQSKRGN